MSIGCQKVSQTDRQTGRQTECQADRDRQNDSMTEWQNSRAAKEPLLFLQIYLVTILLLYVDILRVLWSCLVRVCQAQNLGRYIWHACTTSYQFITIRTFVLRSKICVYYEYLIKIFWTVVEAVLWVFMKPIFLTGRRQVFPPTTPIALSRFIGVLLILFLI